MQDGRRQERYWEDNIRMRYKGQTVRSVCRLPRVYGLVEARNVHRVELDAYLLRLTADEQQLLQLIVVAMKFLLG
jgi:hypothetical protein